MPNLPNDLVATGYPLVRVGNFGVAALEASQAQVALNLNPNDATSGSLNVTGETMPVGGWIVGISATLAANKTAGVFGISPTINGTEVGSSDALYRVPIANAALKCYLLADAGSSARRFAAGDLIGAKVTTDGSYLPTTSDLHVVLFVVFDSPQF